MTYVDGFLIPVKTDMKDAYAAMANDAWPIFKEHGALFMVENWGDDVPEGKVTSFPIAVKLEPDETVVFSWIVWPSRKARDEGMKNVMEDARMKAPDPMPFEMKRMIFGGFETIVNV